MAPLYNRSKIYASLTVRLANIKARKKGKKLSQPVTIEQVHRHLFREVVNEKERNCSDLDLKHMIVHHYHAKQNVCVCDLKKKKKPTQKQTTPGSEGPVLDLLLIFNCSKLIMF